MDWKRKLSSRKLWAALLGAVFGAAMVFGVEGSVVTDVAGAITSLVSVVVYVRTEGKIDQASVSRAAEDIGLMADIIADILRDEEEQDASAAPQHDTL